MTNALGALVPWLRSWARVLHFAGYALTAAASRATYTAATRDVTLRQIYFTAWQILPLYLAFSALLSAILIRVIVLGLEAFGLAEYAVELVLRGLVLELVPFATALFVALRSGVAIATEVALMRVSGELAAIERTGEDPMRTEFVPRVAATMLSIAALTVVSGGIALAIAYLEVYGATPWGLGEFTRSIGKVYDGATMLGFALKCAFFGAAVAVVPIAAGLEATAMVKSAPVAVLRGMVRLVFVLVLIEAAALAARYL